MRSFLELSRPLAICGLVLAPVVGVAAGFTGWNIMTTRSDGDPFADTRAPKAAVKTASTAPGFQLASVTSVETKAPVTRSLARKPDLETTPDSVVTASIVPVPVERITGDP